MTNSSSLVRSRYRTLEGGCVSCSGDLASVQSLPGVRSVDALASGLVLVTHDGTVTDDAVLAAAQAAGLRRAPAGVARSAQRSPN